MRTTLDIDDDVMEKAKELSRLKEQSLGRSVSELARRGLASRPREIEWKNNVPTWKARPGATPITSEMVRRILEEDD